MNEDGSLELYENHTHPPTWKSTDNGIQDY